MTDVEKAIIKQHQVLVWMQPRVKSREAWEEISGDVFDEDFGFPHLDPEQLNDLGDDNITIPRKPF